MHTDKIVSSPLVRKFASHIQIGRALDIGAGRGDNAIFLVKKGFQATAVEIRKDLSEAIKKRAWRNKVKINVENKSLQDFVIQKSHYSFISAINSLHFLSKKEFYKVIGKIKSGLMERGICAISVFTSDDPLYKKVKTNPKRYYPNPGELREIFKDFEILFHIETTIHDKGHPNHEQPHKHTVARIVAKKGKSA